MILEIIININKAFDNIFLALSLSFSPKAIENIGAPPKPTKKANEVIKVTIGEHTPIPIKAISPTLGKLPTYILSTILYKTFINCPTIDGIANLNIDFKVF